MYGIVSLSCCSVVKVLLSLS